MDDGSHSKMLIQFERDQKKLIEAEAHRWGISQASLVRQLVSAGLKRLARKDPLTEL